VLIPPPVPTSAVKKFGPLGQRYVVGQPIRQIEDGDWYVEVTIVDTGEKIEYRRTLLLQDPDAPE